jgi:hypothetical protein
LKTVQLTIGSDEASKTDVEKIDRNASNLFQDFIRVVGVHGIDEFTENESHHRRDS